MKKSAATLENRTVHIIMYRKPEHYCHYTN